MMSGQQHDLPYREVRVQLSCGILKRCLSKSARLKLSILKHFDLPVTPLLIPLHKLPRCRSTLTNQLSYDCIERYEIGCLQMHTVPTPHKARLSCRANSFPFSNLNTPKSAALRLSDVSYILRIPSRTGKCGKLE